MSYNIALSKDFKSEKLTEVWKEKLYYKRPSTHKVRIRE